MPRSICINPGEVATEILAARPKPPTQAEQALLMLQADDSARAALLFPGLPPCVTVTEMTTAPTDNHAWRTLAYAIAKRERSQPIC